MIMEIVISVGLLFVGIAALFVIHVCVVGRATGRGNQGLVLVNMAQTGNTINISIETNDKSGSAGAMSAEELKMIPCFDYVAPPSEKERDRETKVSSLDCAVCLEGFKSGEKCRLLSSCGHSFHSQCIDSWLLKTPICPICRTSAKPNPNAGQVLSEETS